MNNVTWGDLSEAQQELLRSATISSGFIPGGLYTARDADELWRLGLVELRDEHYVATDAGRRVYESREAADAAGVEASFPHTPEQAKYIVATFGGKRAGADRAADWYAATLGVSNKLAYAAVEHILTTPATEAEADMLEWESNAVKRWLREYSDELADLRQQLAAAQADNARMRERDEQWDIATSAIGALTVVLDWLKHKPEDMTEASVIEMIENELGIDSADAGESE